MKGITDIPTVDIMSSTVTVKRKSGGTNDGGIIIGPAVIPHLILDGVRVNPIATREQVFTDKDTVYADHILNVFSEEDISEATDFVFDEDDKEYEIKGISKIKSLVDERFSHLKIEMLEKR